MQHHSIHVKTTAAHVSTLRMYVHTQNFTYMDFEWQHPNNFIFNYFIHVHTATGFQLATLKNKKIFKSCVC